MASPKRPRSTPRTAGAPLTERRLDAARSWIEALSSPSPATLKALRPHLAEDVSTPWTSGGRAKVLASIRDPVRGFVEGSWTEPEVRGKTVRATCNLPSGEDRDAALLRLHLRGDVIASVDVIFFNRKKRSASSRSSSTRRSRSDPQGTRSAHPEVEALYAAMDAQREARAMTWQQAVREINESIRNANVHPLSASTITSMRGRYSLNMNGILQMMVWLDRSPESFADGRRSKTSEKLPPVPARSILRFDVKALHAALDERRSERDMTWSQVAEEVGGFAPAGLKRLKDGGLIGYPHVMRLTRWVGKPVVEFTYALTW